MINRIVDNEFDQLLQHLGQNYSNCFYIYIDAITYGNTDPNVSFYRIGDEFKCVIMKYYDSIQIAGEVHSEDEANLLSFLKNEDVKMITGTKNTLTMLHNKMVNNGTHEYVEGMNYQYESYRIAKSPVKIERATKADARAIAELILSDQTFKNNYEIKTLEQQLSERIASAKGRSYVIKDAQKVIAHIATYAESEHVAVTSGMIVDKAYVNKGYSFYLESYIVNDLLGEEKKVFTQVFDKKRAKLLESLGATYCGDYAKLTRVN